jgi:hypothetical protein
MYSGPGLPGKLEFLHPLFHELRDPLQALGADVELAQG